MGASAREVAFLCLLAGEKQGAWSDGYLRNAIRQADLNSRDAALCTRLANGVLQNRMLLDWHISQLSNTPFEKLDVVVVNALRLGLYQLLLLDRIPTHAAVNESVSLAKRYARNARASGLVNGVLRNFLRRQEAEGISWPEDLATRYSHPEWLVEEFSRILPQNEVEALLAADNTQPPTQAQVNLLKTSTDALMPELIESGVSVKIHDWLPDCLELENTGNMEHLLAFQDGRFYIQDVAARLAVMAAGPQPGMKGLDACGAPGGKSFGAAIRMKGQGSILCCDLHPHKEVLIQKGAARLGIECIQTAVMDGKIFHPELESQFDFVLADVPCSGLGIIRKKPDIRYKDPKPLSDLPKIQKAILANVARYVRPGGVLLYSTCTLLPRENEDVVTWLLESRNDYSLESFAFPGPIGQTEGMVTLWPHRHHTDGFFIAKLRRKA